jgi:methionyl-tRNA formyltransferase
MGYNLKKYLLVTEKPWHDELFNKLSSQHGQVWKKINNKDNLNFEIVKEFNPDFIFIPHWSYLIDKNIFLNWNCIVFHMTDLPFGRGGSPLQNLIVRGYKETKVSAIKVSNGLDTGDVYLKKSLDLKGTAQEIFSKATDVIHEMILEIIEYNPTPIPQSGEITLFQRRKPEDGDLYQLSSNIEIYDYIRMLDCEGYPPAFIETEHFRFEFTGAKLNNDETVKANVRVIKK